MSPVRLEFKGEGSEQDFDAALLTIEIAREGRVSALRGERTEPHPRPQFRLTNKLRGGGEVEVKVRTRATRAVIAIAEAIWEVIQGFLGSPAGFDDERSRSALKRKMQESARQALLDVFAAEPDIRDERPIKVEVRLGKETLMWSIAEGGTLQRNRFAKTAP
jgi:hypothetical protein